MNNSVNKTRAPRSAARKPEPAATASSVPTPPDGPDGAPATPGEQALPGGAVKDGQALAARRAPLDGQAQKAAGQPQARAGKAKLVHGTFALPKDEYAALGSLKKSCQDKGLPVKKSQLLRVAIALLRELDQARLAPMIAALPPVKRAGAGKKRK